MREQHDADQSPLRTRLLWMALLWLAGVAVVGAVATLIRFWLN